MVRLPGALRGSGRSTAASRADRIGARIRDHDAGEGRTLTRAGRGPLAVLATRRCREHGTALRLELLVKRLSRREKLALASNPSLLGRLARKASRARKLASAFACFARPRVQPARARGERILKLSSAHVERLGSARHHLASRRALGRRCRMPILGLEPDIVFFQELWDWKQARERHSRSAFSGARLFRTFGVSSLPRV
jgi:predicted GIY-YIG superfamily endonuclease